MKRATGIGPAVVVALLLAACGNGGDADAGGTEATAGSGAQIVVSGSSTVEPITALVAEEFVSANPEVAPSVEGPGTGDGFARFCAGETDISDASRPIAEDEMESCAAAGVEHVELKVAIDGISVITSPANEAVTCLSFSDLYALLGPESEGFESWSAANDLAAELGGAVAAPYPEAPLVIFAPGEESGTFDSFAEIVLEDIAEERGTEPLPRVDYNASANDNVIVQGIADNETSLGWVGYAFFVENEARLKALEIDGGTGCTAPTGETIASNEYPISRDLFIYVRTNDLASRPELVSFVDYYLSDEGIANAAEAGYVALGPEALEETRAAWEEAKTAAGA